MWALHLELLVPTPSLAFQFFPGDTNRMDTGEMIVVLSRLIMGALAAFFAIMLWSRTRDIAWMLMVGGTIAAYGEVLFGVLGLFGMSPAVPGSLPLVTLIVPNIPVMFFISAFLVMVIRSYGSH
jgi:hypothetical protein